MITRKDLGDGIAALVIDRPGDTHNFKDVKLVTLFHKLITGLIADDTIKGGVLASAKESFIVGGDLKEIRALTSSQEGLAMVERVQASLREMEKADKPFVAAINGLALGGGLEVALACNYRIGVNGRHFKLGLPETSLGLMPGAGGTQRLPRLIGLKDALPMMLDGKQLSAEQALDVGLIDEIAASDGLLDAAKEAILSGKAKAQQAWDQDNFQMPGPNCQSDDGKKILSTAWAKINRRKPGLEPALEAVMTAVEQGLEMEIDEGLTLERKFFSEVAPGKVAKNKIRTLFYGMNAANNMKDRPKDVEPYTIKSVAVIGVGLMGSGISYCAAQAGYDVFLVDIDIDAAKGGVAAIQKNVGRAVERGRQSQEKADKLLSHLTPTADYADIANVDFVVEAVSEVLPIKKAVLEQVAKTVRPGVPIASNTSTMPISELAELTDDPENFIGLHFFSPVDRMKLVEVIKGKKTNNTVLARSLDFISGIRKTPIIVNDGLGFFTSRVVTAYTGEAFTLLAEGIDPAIIDDVSLRAGMPIGPLSMADATTLTLLKDIMASLSSAKGRIGMSGMRIVEALDHLIEDFGRTGKSSGKGIYSYDDSGRHDWPGIQECFPPPETEFSRELIEKRLMHSQALETVRAMEEGIIENAIDADVGSVIGWAFPSAHGGVIGYIHTIGIQQFIAECDKLTSDYGERFTPPQLLRKMVASGKEFYDE